MNEWVLSVAGLVFLLTVLYAVLPQGKTAKIIKSVVGLMTLTVLLKPVITLKNADFDFNGVFNGVEIFLQDDFIYFTLNEKTVFLENGLYEYLLDENVSVKSVEISLCFDDEYKISTNYVKIYLKSNANYDVSEHIVFTEKAVKYLSAYVIVNAERIEIYE